MSRDAIIEHVRELYREKGPATLTFSELKKAGIYFHLYHKGITQKELVELVGAHEAYERYKVATFISSRQALRH
jgi:hypothetical protein